MEQNKSFLKTEASPRVVEITAQEQVPQVEISTQVRYAPPLPEPTANPVPSTINLDKDLLAKYDHLRPLSARSQQNQQQ